MTDALHSILQYAESLEMPEGQYLKVANALRDAFHQMPKKNADEVWNDYPLPENYLVVRLQKAQFATTCEEVHIAYRHVFMSNARRVGPSRFRLKARVEYLSKDAEPVIKEYLHTERTQTFDTVYEQYEPTRIVIEWEGVSYTYECDSMLCAMKQGHDRIRRLNRGVEDVEDDDDDIYWNETNFYTAVFNRVINIGKNYFWERFHEDHDN
jgi:hypothetical protein